MTRRVSAALLGLAIGLAGCSTERTQSHQSLDQATLSNPEASTVQLDVPPRQLVDLVRQTLAQQPYNLQVDKQEGGRLLTGWQRFPGQFRIARRWQERTRYLVNISPQFDDPANKSQIIVMQETQTRATDGQNWKPLVDIDRSERARQLAEDIRRAVAGPR